MVIEGRWRIKGYMLGPKATHTDVIFKLDSSR